MKTKTFLLSSLVAFSAIALTSPALAHDGYPYGRGHYEHHFFHPGHRVVIVRPPVVVYRPAPVYYYHAPAPVYYSAPAPVYYEPNSVGTIGGAIAGAAIGGIAGHGQPGAIAAGSVIGAVVGSTLPR